MKTKNNDEPNFFLIAAGFMLVFTVGLFILHFFKYPVDVTILDTQVRSLGLESTRAQLSLFLAIFSLFAIICTIMLLFPSIKMLTHATYSGKLIAVTVIISAVVLGSASRQFLWGLLITAGALALLQTRWPTIYQDSWTKLLYDRRIQLASGFLFWFVLVSIGCYFIFFVLWPLATPLLIPDASVMRSIEAHYAFTVLPGFDLCCSGEGSVQRANYGIAMPLLTAISLKLFAFFGLPDTDLVRAVKLNQAIAAAMICALGYLANKKYYPYVIALMLGLTAFTLSNIGAAVGYPNQSGIRYIPALAALIVLILEMRRIKMRTCLLASVSALVVIMSPETGMATSVGYVVAVILNRYIPQAPIASTLRTLAMFMVTFAIVLMIGSNLILGMALKGASGGLFQFVMLFTAGGYGGLVTKPSVFASLVFLVVITMVLRSVWRARKGKLQATDIHEAAVGSIMLVWLMYYVNRMSEWNLWFELVLLVLLIAPRLSLSAASLWFLRPVKFDGLTLVIVCLIGGQAAASATKFILFAKEGIRSQQLGCNEGASLDGKCLPWLKDSNFEFQIKALTEKYSPADTLVLSGVSTYARLRGFNAGFPWYTPAEVIRKKDVSAIVEWINSHGPKYVIADDPVYEIAVASLENSNQIQAYIPLLSSYRKISKESGWIVLERAEGYQPTVGVAHPAQP